MKIKITIKTDKLGIIYRIKNKTPFVSCHGLAHSIQAALREIGKTLARMPNEKS